MGSSPAHQHFSDPTLVAATDEATGVAFTVAAAVVVAAAAAAAAPVAVVGYAAAGTSCAFPPTTTAIAVPDTAVAAAAVVGVSQIFHSIRVRSSWCPLVPHLLQLTPIPSSPRGRRVACA